MAEFLTYRLKFFVILYSAPGCSHSLKNFHNISEIKKLGETWPKSNKQLSGSVEFKKHVSYRLPKKIIDSEI